jgi:hypothetical protein
MRFSPHPVPITIDRGDETCSKPANTAVDPTSHYTRNCERSCEVRARYQHISFYPHRYHSAGVGKDVIIELYLKLFSWA